jgi:hypothetical protein
MVYIWSYLVFGVNTMSLSVHIKPISYLKANAAKIAAGLKNDDEAAMIVKSVAECEHTQETIAMLQLTALGEKEIVAGKTVKAKEAFAQIRNKIGFSK